MSDLSPSDCSGDVRLSHGQRRLRSWAIAEVARHSTWLSLLGCLLLVFVIYGRALGFTFFFDDPFDLTRVEDRSYWTLLSSAEGYQYYRPVPAFIWKFLFQLQGHYQQATLHALPLVAHAVCSWLLYILLRRFDMGYWAILPTLLFLTNPFHYQVLPIIGPTAHVLAATFILASLNLYVMARLAAYPRRAVQYHLVALAATCFALWSHESGVVIAAFIVGIELLVLGWQRHGWLRPSPWIAAHIVATIGYLIAWSSVDKLPSTERTSLSELQPKSLFFLQGFTYPVSAQLVWIEDHLGVAVGVLEAGVAACVFVFAMFSLAAHRSGQLKTLVTPLAAAAVAVIASQPSMLRLSWGYVENGPRLLYLLAIGSALFWGFLPSLSLGNYRVTIAWRTATILLLCGVVAQSWRFIEIRMDMFESGTRMIDGIVAAGEQYQGPGLLVVNAPSWFAQNRYEYRYGHYGVQLMPDYIGLDRVIYANSERAPHVDVRSVEWQADVSGGKYPFGPHGFQAPPEDLDAFLREGRQLVTVTPQGSDYIVHAAGRLQPGAAERLAGSPGRIGAGIWLDGARVAVTSTHPNLVTLYITWNVLEPPRDELDTVVELRDGGGNVIARYEGYALDGMSAPRLWQAGDKVDDAVAFSLPLPGSYSFWVGLRHRETGEWLQVFSADGIQSSENILQVGEVQVTETSVAMLPIR